MSELKLKKSPSTPKDDVEQSKNKIISNRYKIESRLSKTVYLVKDAKSNDELKICKMIHVNLMEANTLKETLREGYILSKVDSPYIVKYYESFMFEDNLCIITEYCDGGDLSQRLKKLQKDRQRLSEEKLLRWFTHILSAAHSLHQLKVLHRNIKPKNIFIKNETLKLGDFGISRILKDSVDNASTFVGTPYFMAPEIIRNESYNSPTDIWSIGCVIFELATYQHPFVGDKLHDVFNAILNDEPPSVVNLYSKELNSILKKIFTKISHERPTASELLQEPLIFNHIKKSITKSLNRATTGNQVSRLANFLSQIQPDEEDFGEYDNKGTI